MESLFRARRLPVTLLVGLALILGPTAARADVTLWYNGDFNGKDALANLVSNTSGATASTSDGIVYEDFVVPAGHVWTLSSVFSNDILGSTTASAYYEIRTGVSAGNGGSIVSSGSGTATETTTGNTFNTGFNTYSEYKVSLTGLSVTLNPGTYYLAVAPVGTNIFSGVSTTSGANAVGTPPGNDGNSFINSAFYGYNFASTASLNNGTPTDYSLGVVGTSFTSSVPEPSSMSLTLVAGLGLAGLHARRRRRAS